MSSDLQEIGQLVKTVLESTTFAKSQLSGDLTWENCYMTGELNILRISVKLSGLLGVSNLFA